MSEPEGGHLTGPPGAPPTGAPPTGAPPSGGHAGGRIDGESAAPLVLDGEPQALDPRVRTVWAVGNLVGALVLGAIVLVLVLVLQLGVVITTVTGAVLAVVAATAWWWASLRWNRWRWAVWPDGLELRHGVIFRELSLVPYHRIQQIDVHRGPVERLLGLSTLIIRTAAATTDGTIPGVAADQAEGLRHQLLAMAGVDDAV